MTILGAFSESPESLILGADSLASSTDSTGTSRAGGPIDKWHQVGDKPVMWGWCGSGWGEIELEKWVVAVADLGWPAIHAAASQAVRTLNGVFGNPERYADLMIAGFMNQQAGILAVSARGTVNYPDRQMGTSARFLGCSSFGAWLAWDILGQESPESQTRESFRRLIALTVERDPMLNGCATWEVVPSGCRPLSVT
jgi:hypothetical protein